MVSFDDLLGALYEIQGNADPNHDKPSMEERMSRIWDIACDMMQRSGWQPPDMPCLTCPSCGHDHTPYCNLGR